MLEVTEKQGWLKAKVYARTQGRESDRTGICGFPFVARRRKS